MAVFLHAAIYRNVIAKDTKQLNIYRQILSEAKPFKDS